MSIIVNQSNNFTPLPSQVVTTDSITTNAPTRSVAPTSGTISYQNPRQSAPSRNFSPRTLRIATPRTTAAQQQIATTNQLTDAARANAIARRNSYAEQIIGLQNELANENTNPVRKAEIERETAQLTQNIMEIDQQIGYVVAAPAV